MIALQNVTEVSTHANEVYIEFEYDDWNLGWTDATLFLKPYSARELVEEIQKALLELEADDSDI